MLLDNENIFCFPNAPHSQWGQCPITGIRHLDFLVEHSELWLERYSDHQNQACIFIFVCNMHFFFHKTTEQTRTTRNKYPTRYNNATEKSLAWIYCSRRYFFPFPIFYCPLLNPTAIKTLLFLECVGMFFYLPSIYIQCVSAWIFDNHLCILCHCVIIIICCCFYSGFHIHKLYFSYFSSFRQSSSECRNHLDQMKLSKYCYHAGKVKVPHFHSPGHCTKVTPAIWNDGRHLGRIPIKQSNEIEA